MTIVGITGHQSIPDEALQYVIADVQRLLSQQVPPLIGLSSLAAGADQLFAHEVITMGGTLHAIIPSAKYEQTLSGNDRSQYLDLKRCAAKVDVLDYDEPSEEAFDAAGRRISELCDIMIAIWDGKASRGQGGTADAVGHARQHGKPVHIVWPEGVSRNAATPPTGTG